MRKPEKTGTLVLNVIAIGYILILLVSTYFGDSIDAHGLEETMNVSLNNITIIYTLLATFVGAAGGSVVGYLLQNSSNKRKEREKQFAYACEVIFLIHRWRKYIDEYEERFVKKYQNDPLKMIAIPASSDFIELENIEHIDFGKLSYLLRKEWDLSSKLYRLDKNYYLTRQLIDERSKLLVDKIHSKMAEYELANHERVKTTEQLEELIGSQYFIYLNKHTDSLIDGIAEWKELSQELNESFWDTVQKIFPDLK